MTHNPAHRIPRPHLRADGNLTYLQFIALLRGMWEDAHPGIPLVPAQDTTGETWVKYPCIVYGIEVRQTHPQEPKLRQREERADEDGDIYVIQAQRFRTIVSFIVYTQNRPEDAEHIIEVFEDFMMEYTPVFKKLGLSEIVYSRRLSDMEENRQGHGVTTRGVSYLVTTEKVISSKVDKLERVLIHARTRLEALDEHASDNDATPRYWISDGIKVPTFHVEEGNTQLFIIPSTNFRVGDVVYLAHALGESFPPNLQPGYRMIINIIGTPYSQEIQYELSDVVYDSDAGEYKSSSEPPEPIDAGGAGVGKAFYVPDIIIRNLPADEFKSGV